MILKSFSQSCTPGDCCISKVLSINGSNHPFLFHITGTPQSSDSQAVSQNVSKNVDGIRKKSDSDHVQMISFLCVHQ
jgi:hypothetical protein